MGKVQRLEAELTAAANRSAEVESEAATLSARLRAGELHLSAAEDKWEQERSHALGGAQEQHEEDVAALKAALQTEHAAVQKANLARMIGLSNEVKAQADKLESLRAENAALRTAADQKTEQQQQQQQPVLEMRDGAPAEAQSGSGRPSPPSPVSPTARIGKEVALVAATKRTDGLEREVTSLRQEVLRLQNKLASYRAREQDVANAAKHSGK